MVSEFSFSSFHLAQSSDTLCCKASVKLLLDLFSFPISNASIFSSLSMSFKSADSLLWVFIFGPYFPWDISCIAAVAHVTGSASGSGITLNSKSISPFSYFIFLNLSLYFVISESPSFSSSSRYLCFFPSLFFLSFSKSFCSSAFTVVFCSNW